MHDELTRIDLEKMQAELDERRLKLMPELIEEVKRTRAFGDLSENYEYKAAKQAQNRNRSRIRYLEKMIASAKIIEDTSAEDEVGLYDKVDLWMEEDGEMMSVKVVTTVRCDPLGGLISKESPLGMQLLGKHVGDSFKVQVNETYRYTATVRSIEKGSDDGSAGLLQYCQERNGCVLYEHTPIFYVYIQWLLSMYERMMETRASSLSLLVSRQMS